MLRFLLSRQGHGCARDELLAEFWPEVSPGAARNRLQVAVSGLRRTLQEATNLHVIEYADGGYRINPELLVEVDVERFNRALSAARAAERAGPPIARWPPTGTRSSCTAGTSPRTRPMSSGRCCPARACGCRTSTPWTG